MLSTTTLGLNHGPGSGNLAPYYTMFHFVFAYVVLSARPAKNYLKIDHNVSPRGDISKHGPKAVSEGKITQRQLNFLQRNEACHANSMENFPVFASAAIFATIAGIDASRINNTCAVYTVARIIYAVFYLTVDSYGLSFIRTVAWLVGTFACLELFWTAGNALNGF